MWYIHAHAVLLSQRPTLYYNNYFWSLILTVFILDLFSIYQSSSSFFLHTHCKHYLQPILGNERTLIRFRSSIKHTHIHTHIHQFISYCHFWEICAFVFVRIMVSTDERVVAVIMVGGPTKGIFHLPCSTFCN